jgi:hypothetical protein
MVMNSRFTVLGAALFVAACGGGGGGGGGGPVASTPPASGGSASAPSGSSSQAGSSQQQDTSTAPAQNNPPASGGQSDPPASGGQSDPAASGGQSNPPASGGSQPPPTPPASQTFPASAAAANYDSRSGNPPAAFVNITGIGTSPSDGSNTVTIAPDRSAAHLTLRAGGVVIDRDFAIVGSFDGLPATTGDAVLALNDLSASSFGPWAVKTGDTTWQIGAVAFGTPTPVANMPMMGTATYNGTTSGIHTSAAASSRIDGRATIGVDFAGMTAATSFTNLRTVSGRTLPDVGGTAQISGNRYSGNVSGSFSMFGTVQGTFYGPAAEETAGTWAVQGKPFGGILSPTESITAGFGARR